MSKPSQRWVVKAGSNIIFSGGPLLLQAWMSQVLTLRRHFGIEVIWVTSGAIASGMERTGLPLHNKKRSLAEKQALSAIGQPITMYLYNLALQTAGLCGAQVLLTYDDLAKKKQKGNFIRTIEQLLQWGTVPIINENDATATEEIRFGDNDSLSAKVAHAMHANRLVILTDVEGLYGSDPRKNSDARLIHRVSAVTPRMISSVRGSIATARGTGGMASKLMAAREATLLGIDTWLAKGDAQNVLLRIASNEVIGTRFEAKKRR